MTPPMAAAIAPAMAPPMANRWQSTWQNNAPVARSPYPVVSSRLGLSEGATSSVNRHLRNASDHDGLTFEGQTNG